MLSLSSKDTAPRDAAQQSLRDNAVSIAAGVAGVSVIALLAAGAALPFVISTDNGPAAAVVLTALGSNALGGWLVEWAKVRMQTARFLKSEITLHDLAQAIDAQQQSNQAIADDIQLLINATDAVAVTCEALVGKADQQLRLLTMLVEDVQQARVRNERLHEATYQAVLNQCFALQQSLAQSHADLAAQIHDLRRQLEDRTQRDASML